MTLGYCDLCHLHPEALVPLLTTVSGNALGVRAPSGHLGDHRPLSVIEVVPSGRQGWRNLRK